MEGQDCTNRITFKSTEKTLNKIKLDMQSTDGNLPFDFNRLIPMPAELLDTELFAIGKKDYYYSNKKFISSGESMPPSIEWIKKHCLDPFTLRRLKNSYGYLSSQDWAVKNWGIMSNATNGLCIKNIHDHDMKQSELVYTFDTVWSEPQPVYDALCGYIMKDTDGNSVSLQWYFEDTSQNYSGYMSGGA